MGLVEAPRGEAMHWIMAGQGAPFRHKVRDPSFSNWLAIEFAVLGDIVPDFPSREQEPQPLLCWERPVR